MINLLFLLFVTAWAVVDPFAVGTQTGNFAQRYRVPPSKTLLLEVSVPNGFFTDSALATELIWSSTGKYFPGERAHATYYANHPLQVLSRTGGKVTFGGLWYAPPRECLQVLSWTLPAGAAPNGATVSRFVEVTCSNGRFCDGIERWNGTQCLPGSEPCDDDEPCTIDACTEQFGGHCVWTRTDTNECQADNKKCGEFKCVSNCTGKVCGDNGCTGVCGTCQTGNECVDGACEVAPPSNGTCANPFDLFSGAGFSFGEFTVDGDTSTLINLLSPACNILSQAKEAIYHFKTPASGAFTDFIGGIFFVTGGPTYSDFDTVLEVFEGFESCLVPNTALAVNPDVIGCSDDATPPGNFGSRVEAKLLPDTDYYVHVDGYSQGYNGPFSLRVKFVADCVPVCDGNYCGDDSCGGTCGSCDAGSSCTLGKCFVDGCVPDCTLGDGSPAECGVDGCGGDCGGCPSNSSCDYDPTNGINTGVCTFHAKYDCDSFNPICTGCTGVQYCGMDCECHNIQGNALADLIPEVPELYTEENLVFSNLSCAIQELCATAATTRIMRMTVRSANYGFADMDLPEIKDFGHLFHYSACHNHWHFANYAKYILFDSDGVVVASGGKQSYCLEDFTPLVQAPWVECDPFFDCGSQGILRGWTDEYGASLDCQWLDISGLTSGNYRLEVHLNYARVALERSVENNYIAIDVVLAVGGITDWNFADDPIGEFSPYRNVGVGLFPSLTMVLVFIFSIVFQ